MTSLRCLLVCFASACALRRSPTGTCILTNVNCGKVLEVENNSTANGANVWQWDGSGARSSQWMIRSMYGGAYYTFTNINSGKLLTVQGNKTGNGANVWLWDGNGKTSAQWQFACLSPSTPSPTPS